jgi:predicted O-methyltransferase YrrM
VASLHCRDYYPVLGRLHTAIRPETYLEIGVSKGRSLALAADCAVAVGIDPEPVLSSPPAANARVFEMTSDEFFAAHNVRAELGDRDLDMAFVDGLHLFEHAVRDFANVERSSTPKTLVVLHDCLPIDEVTASRERTTSTWTGDVWKTALVLLRYRPDLRLTIIDVPPSGLVVVEGLDPSSRVLDDHAEEILAEYAGLGFDYWERHRGEVLALVEDLESVLGRLERERSTSKG